LNEKNEEKKFKLIINFKGSLFEIYIVY